MRRSRIGRVGRASALGVALAIAGLAAASCRDIVTDDVVDARAALCSSFASCEVDARACQHLGAFFRSHDDPTYADYLAYYVEWNCGDSCGAVDVCLDFELLCEPTRESCDDDFECCDASTGAAACKEGRCCYGLGVVCTGPEDCCGLDDGTEVACFTRQEGAPTTCGGVEACKLRGEDCEEDDDCCGKAACVRGTCETVTCVERGARCGESDGCCVPGDECQDGTCHPRDVECNGTEIEPPCCIALDTTCTADGQQRCCGGNVCLAGVDGEGLCRPPDSCGPTGTVCLIDADCCENGKDLVGCVAPNPDGSGTRSCATIGCQLEFDAPCGENGVNCCTGLSCLPSRDPSGGSTCQEPCLPTACHDIREFGAPLRRDCALEGLPEDQASCAATICEADPFCCCYGWTDFCVIEAEKCLGPDPTSPAE